MYICTHVFAASQAATENEEEELDDDIAVTQSQTNFICSLTQVYINIILYIFSDTINTYIRKIMKFYCEMKFRFCPVLTGWDGQSSEKQEMPALLRPRGYTWSD